MVVVLRLRLPSARLRRSGSCVSDRNLYGGMTRLVGAGTPLNTRPARSNFDRGRGRKSRPASRRPRSAGATSGRKVGEQPRCVQMPTGDQYFRLERAVLVLGVRRLLVDARTSGSATLSSSFGRLASIAGVRLMIHTDLAAPFDVDLLAGLELADVDFDRRARRLGALAGPHAHAERHRGRDRADGADRRRGADQEPALSLVHASRIAH